MDKTSTVKAAGTERFDLIPGKILSCIGGIYTVDALSGENGRFYCTARGVFRHNNVTPVAGDDVMFFTEKEDKGCVYSVC